MPWINIGPGVNCIDHSCLDFQWWHFFCFLYENIKLFMVAKYKMIQYWNAIHIHSCVSRGSLKLFKLHTSSEDRSRQGRMGISISSCPSCICACRWMQSCRRSYCCCCVANRGRSRTCVDTWTTCRAPSLHTWSTSWPFTKNKSVSFILLPK